jgi:GWxTD domain-containing protein
MMNGMKFSRRNETSLNFFGEGFMNNMKNGTGIFLLLCFGFLCFSACSVGLFPSKDPWYAQHYIIMQDFEWDTYKTLSETAKTQFQELFWKVRDPQAQQIFQSRLKVATESFKKENSSTPWNTDRGRIFLLHGKPAELRYVEDTSMGGRDYTSTITSPQRAQVNVDRSGEDIGARMSELWVYPFKGYLINYKFDFSQPRQWKLSTNMSESAYRDEFELNSRVMTYRIIDVEKYKAQLEELKKIKE